MRRLRRHAARGHWPTGEAIATVTLDYDARHRRRIRLAFDGGGEALLDLDRAVALAGGDGLQLETGEWIAVIAAPEPILEITAPDPLLRMRLAWHLGNRHVPAELGTDRIRIRPDHVLRDMLVGLGAVVTERIAAFQPERGAYDGASASHSHSHAHDHDPDHSAA
ncbi:MAG: urease accessory protein UreE [Myxococcota bacterium]